MGGNSDVGSLCLKMLVFYGIVMVWLMLVVFGLKKFPSLSSFMDDVANSMSDSNRKTAAAGVEVNLLNQLALEWQISPGSEHRHHRVGIAQRPVVGFRYIPADEGSSACT